MPDQRLPESSHPDAHQKSHAGGHGPEPSHPPPQEIVDLGHQPETISVGGLVKFAAVMVVLAVLIHLALAGLYVLFRESPHPGDTEKSPFKTVDTFKSDATYTLQSNEPDDLTEIRKTWNEKLTTYATIPDDTGKSTVRIPIKEAMSLVAHGKLPPGANTATQPASPSSGGEGGEHVH